MWIKGKVVVLIIAVINTGWIQARRLDRRCGGECGNYVDSRPVGEVHAAAIDQHGNHFGDSSGGSVIGASIDQKDNTFSSSVYGEKIVGAQITQEGNDVRGGAAERKKNNGNTRPEPGPAGPSSSGPGNWNGNWYNRDSWKRNNGNTGPVFDPRGPPSSSVDSGNGNGYNRDSWKKNNGNTGPESGKTGPTSSGIDNGNGNGYNGDSWKKNNGNTGPVSDPRGPPSSSVDIGNGNGYDGELWKENDGSTGPVSDPRGPTSSGTGNWNGNGHNGDSWERNNCYTGLVPGPAGPSLSGPDTRNGNGYSGGSWERNDGNRGPMPGPAGPLSSGPGNWSGPFGDFQADTQPGFNHESADGHTSVSWGESVYKNSATMKLSTSAQPGLSIGSTGSYDHQFLYGFNNDKTVTTSSPTLQQTIPLNQNDGNAAYNYTSSTINERTVSNSLPSSQSDVNNQNAGDFQSSSLQSLNFNGVNVKNSLNFVQPADEGGNVPSSQYPFGSGYAFNNVAGSMNGIFVDNTPGSGNRVYIGSSIPNFQSGFPYSPATDDGPDVIIVNGPDKAIYVSDDQVNYVEKN